MAEEKIITEVTKEIMQIFKVRGISNPDCQRQIIRRLMFEIKWEESYEGKLSDTRDFLSKVKGLDLAAKRIGKVYPTVQSLTYARLETLRAIDRVGQKTLEKVYNALVVAGENPRWIP